MAKKNKQTVDEYMAALDHPFKAEVQVIRDIIKGVHPGITEQVKWNAPSFSYKDDIVTFNLHARQHVHLVFHNPFIAEILSPILEGDYHHRRMTYFANLDEVNAKKSALVQVVEQLIQRLDEERF